MRILNVLAVAGLATSMTGAAHAAIVTPVSATGSSSFPGYEDIYAIDQGGGAAISDWSSLSEGAGAFLDLDLGASYNLATAYVTDRVTSGGPNFNYFGGTTDFTTQYSLQAFTDATFSTAIGSALVFSKPTPGAPTGVASFLDVESVAGLSGQYIRYTVLASNGANAGLSDIHFDSTVPEPAAWGLMIAGFGMVGFSARRRRIAVAA